MIRAPSLAKLPGVGTNADRQTLVTKADLAGFNPDPFNNSEWEQLSGGGGSDDPFDNSEWEVLNGN